MSTTQGTYLVYRTVEDVNQIKEYLAKIHDLIDRIGERYGALTVAVLADFIWPDGYSQADFESLCAVLNALPDSVVTTASRNAIFKLVSSFQ